MVKCSVENLPFRKDVFDYALLSEVLEHLPHPEKAIGDLNQAMKNQALAVIVAPNDFNYFVLRILLLKVKEAFIDRGILIL